MAEEKILVTIALPFSLVALIDTLAEDDEVDRAVQTERRVRLGMMKDPDGRFDDLVFGESGEQ